MPSEGALRYGAAMDPQEPISSALSEAKARRATLHEAIVHLEMAISSPAAGRLPGWTALVRKELTGVRDAFEQHIIATEKPGGLYDEITARAPRLVGTVRRLRDEHPEIAETIASHLERFESGAVGDDAWPLEETRDDLQRFLGTVIRHRQRGADLVWEAYNVDIGGTE